MLTNTFSSFGLRIVQLVYVSVDVFMTFSVPAGVLRVLKTCSLRRCLPTFRITCCINLHDALFLENVVLNNLTAVAEMTLQLKSNLRLVIFFLSWGFETILFFYKVMLSAPHLTPNLDSQVIPFLSGSSPLTCPAPETLPVATLQPAQFSGSFDHASSSTTSK